MKQYTFQPNSKVVIPASLLMEPDFQLTLHANVELIVLDDALRDKIAHACAQVLMRRTEPQEDGA